MAGALPVLLPRFLSHWSGCPKPTLFGQGFHGVVMWHLAESLCPKDGRRLLAFLNAAGANKLRPDRLAIKGGLDYRIGL
ncbi:hypothetical protein [Paracoccus xiamenensis]|uniref:hypothetical protein n=1 Tax=Paracoccus xiamenensis TaxID=2714901 RepID=UPI00140E83B6|nr:hypothetical protein [Paracoccus xiamenensis]NHF73267.1 hypothetical protein [Paracoccus xiamenensis]